MLRHESTIANGETESSRGKVREEDVEQLELRQAS